MCLKNGEFLRKSIAALAEAGVPNPNLDAQVLMAAAAGVEPYRLVVDSDKELHPDICLTAQGYIERRCKFEPVAYITGRKEFYSLEFRVDKNVLIPRPETELLVDMGIFYAPQSGSVLDLCTGSGIIAVALKYSRSDLKVTASDIYGEALSVARTNAGEIAGGGIEFIQSDLFAAMAGRKFDLIISNPPYVSMDDMDSLAPDLAFEPRNALCCEDGGFSVIERILSEASSHLNEGGILLLEIGDPLKNRIKEAAPLHGFSVTILNDHAGLARVATCRMADGED